MIAAPPIPLRAQVIYWDGDHMCMGTVLAALGTQVLVNGVWRERRDVQAVK